MTADNERCLEPGPRTREEFYAMGERFYRESAPFYEAKRKLFALFGVMIQNLDTGEIRTVLDDRYEELDARLDEIIAHIRTRIFTRE